VILPLVVLLIVQFVILPIPVRVVVIVEPKSLVLTWLYTPIIREEESKHILNPLRKVVFVMFVLF
jgi:hypothetical protein